MTTWKLVIATRNRNKLKEIERVLGDVGVELLTAHDFPHVPEIEEDGDTFCANADKKALIFARYTGLTALADDSGLAVTALSGRPGVFSARYAGIHATDGDNVQKLLRDMEPIPDQERGAHFVCVISLASSDGRVRRFEGSVAGTVLRVQRGKNGFGYDPVFVPDGRTETFAEMSAEEKDVISHRGQALAAFAMAMREKSMDTFWMPT
ncbi:MAG: XTP/dITP diphosphatase [Magnetococcales bacterium]|nr:XTP/dITP diphosphatase [Magnetococcales bacterium]